MRFYGVHGWACLVTVSRTISETMSWPFWPGFVDVPHASDDLFYHCLILGMRRKAFNILLYRSLVRNIGVLEAQFLKRQGVCLLGCA